MIREEYSVLVSSESSSLQATSLTLPLPSPLIPEKGEHFRVAVNQVSFSNSFPTITNECNSFTIMFTYANDRQDWASGGVYEGTALDDRLPWSLELMMTFESGYMAHSDIRALLNSNILTVYDRLAQGSSFFNALGVTQRLSSNLAYRVNVNNSSATNSEAYLVFSSIFTSLDDQMTREEHSLSVPQFTHDPLTGRTFLEYPYQGDLVWSELIGGLVPNGNMNGVTVHVANDSFAYRAGFRPNDGGSYFYSKMIDFSSREGPEIGYAFGVYGEEGYPLWNGGGLRNEFPYLSLSIPAPFDFFANHFSIGSADIVGSGMVHIGMTGSAYSGGFLLSIPLAQTPFDTRRTFSVYNRVFYRIGKNHVDSIELDFFVDGRPIAPNGLPFLVELHIQRVFTPSAEGEQDTAPLRAPPMLGFRGLADNYDPYSFRRLA